MKRLLLYVHFNKYGALSGHVLYQLEHMRPLFSQIVVISNSTLSQEDEMKLYEIGLLEILQRENKGYDFAAWRDGMNHIGFENLGQYDSVTLMNDTCFGPLWDVEPIFAQFEDRSDIDFWGMTNFRRTKYFKEHLQSYFLSFSKKVVSSQQFRTFWSSIKNFENVQDVIDNYETQVTTNLIEAGYRYDAVFNTLLEDAGDLVHPDFSYYRPLDIIEHKVPFLKVKAIQEQVHTASQILRNIRQESTYPIQLIKEHCFRFVAPDSPFLLEDKLLTLEQVAQKPSSKILVHLFISNLDLGQNLIQKLSTMPFSYSLVLTASTPTILEVLKHSELTQRHLYAGVFDNHAVALQQLQDLLEGFDIVGHFHTEGWNKVMSAEVFTTLSEKALMAISHLENVASKGLVFSDIPTSNRFTGIKEVDVKKRKQVWEKLPHQKRIPETSYVISVPQAFFWVKSEALTRFFEVKDKEIESSILVDYLVYLAWDQGYDFSLLAAEPFLTAHIERSVLTQDWLEREKQIIMSQPSILKSLKNILRKFLP